MLITGICISILIFCGYGGHLIGKINAAKKPIEQVNKPSTNPVGVYGFQKHDCVICPACKRSWSFRGVKYCDCNKFREGHFHFTCFGNDRNGNEDGCYFKWIMKTR